MSTLVRGRRNRTNAERAWGMGDKEGLKNMAVSFYKNLFTEDQLVGKSFMMRCYPPLLEDAHQRLQAEFSI